MSGARTEVPAPRRIPAPEGIRQFIGVDGCRAGWIAVHAGEGGALRSELIPSGQLARLKPRDGSSALVLMDIPMGLPDHLWRLGKDDGTRDCDREARRLLGRGRASSVFNPPSRDALDTADIYELKRGLTLAQRKAIHRKVSADNKRETGLKLSMQALGIVDKVREVDSATFDIEVDLSAVWMWEAHPELCLWAMNGGQPMAYAKRREPGFRERIQVLERVWPGAGGFSEREPEAYRRADVQRDDLVDALVLAIAARRGYPDGFRALPAKPEKDSLGLPMQMVYWQPVR